MKITGGELKNKTITFVDQSVVRPTSSRVREAIFSMLGQDLSGLSFLDAFGGSGIMAIEAFSRGASSVFVSEINSKVYRSIRKSIDELDANISVLKIDANTMIKRQRWDVIFLDPPYDMDVRPFLKASYDSVEHYIVVETNKLMDLEDCPVPWVRWKLKRYGNSKITIFKKNN